MNHSHLNAAQARQLIRTGEWRRPTTGLALGYVQANVVILPLKWAEEFTAFCRHNRQSAPLLGMTSPGNPHPTKIAPDADIRTDIPRYRIYHNGALAEEREDIRSIWREDFVTFLLGCSFSAERALIEQGIHLRHIEQEKNVAMYRTTLSCTATTHFHGPVVVSMRPIKKSQLAHVIDITNHYPLAHGAPIHVGEPATLGIADLAHPDWGDAVAIDEDEVPVFWACGVTPQAVIMEVKPEIAITHAPGHMFITDWLDTAIYQHVS